MILLPAIDIRGGAAVRLEQGDYERETRFDADPVDAALRWRDQGARALHVVDLDGARQGRAVNLDHVARICAATELPVQLGGGLRDAEAVDAALEAGAERVVLGTSALEDPALVESLAAEYGERIAVGADTRSGQVAVEGWERSAQIAPAELVADMARRGVRRFVITPVEVDGTLAGPGLEALRGVAASAEEADAQILYSGGVGSLEHLRALADLGLEALSGVIVGRALYEGRFTVAEGEAALAATEKP